MPVGGGEDSKHENALFTQLGLLEISGFVNFLGATVDLRHQKLPFKKWRDQGLEWRAQGLGLEIGPKEAYLTVKWAPASELPPLQGMSNENAARKCRIDLFPGDRLEISEVEFWKVKDPGLAEVDKQRATAKLVVKRTSGQNEKLKESVTFASVLLLETGFGIAQANFATMKRRLEELESEVFRSPDKYGPKAAQACRVANELFDDLRVETQRVATLRAHQSEPMFVQDASANIAAAFGYAFAQAEAEFGSRYEVRAGRKDRSKGGKISGIKRAETTAAWQAEALIQAQKLDQSKKPIKRSRMASLIMLALEPKFTIGHASVENWLKDVAEKPNGPIRSRARETKGTKLVR